MLNHRISNELNQYTAIDSFEPEYDADGNQNHTRNFQFFNISELYCAIRKLFQMNNLFWEYCAGKKMS